MTYKEQISIPVASVRWVCISHKFYTLGTNEDYQGMLCNFVSEGCTVCTMTVEGLELMALDIVSHSEPSSFDTSTNAVTTVMNLLAEEATVTYSIA